MLLIGCSVSFQGSESRRNRDWDANSVDGVPVVCVQGRKKESEGEADMWGRSVSQKEGERKEGARGPGCWAEASWAAVGKEGGAGWARIRERSGPSGQNRGRERFSFSFVFIFFLFEKVFKTHFKILFKSV